MLPVAVSMIGESAALTVTVSDLPADIHDHVQRVRLFGDDVDSVQNFCLESIPRHFQLVGARRKFAEAEIARRIARGRHYVVGFFVGKGKFRSRNHRSLAVRNRSLKTGSELGMNGQNVQGKKHNYDLPPPAPYVNGDRWIPCGPA